MLDLSHVATGVDLGERPRRVNPAACDFAVGNADLMAQAQVSIGAGAPVPARRSPSIVAASDTGRRGARRAKRGTSRGGRVRGAASLLRDAPLLDAAEQLDEYPVEFEDHVGVLERRVILKCIVGRTDGEFPIDHSGTGRG